MNDRDHLEAVRVEAVRVEAVRVELRDEELVEVSGGLFGFNVRPQPSGPSPSVTVNGGPLAIA
jgi:hypothetical protein